MFPVPSFIRVGHSAVNGLPLILLTLGRLLGLPISEGLMVCYRLFADDMGMFIPAIEVAFHVARDAISMYERASSAKLNVAKSIVIPFGVPVIPLWFLNFGCLIKSPGVIHKYLGAPWGSEIEKANFFDFCIDGISKRLNPWSNRTLSFTSQSLLIRHVLQAIPIYHMLFIGMSKGVAKTLY